MTNLKSIKFVGKHFRNSTHDDNFKNHQFLVGKHFRNSAQDDNFLLENILETRHKMTTSCWKTF
jgi:ribosomal protein L6P/L9E